MALNQYKKQRNRSNKALSVLIAGILGILVFIGLFMAANHLIHWVAGMFSNHDIQLLCVIILWIVSFSTVLYVAILITGFFFGLFKGIFDQLY